MSYRVITLCLEKKENAKMLTDVAASIIGDNDGYVQTVHIMPSGLDYLSVSPYVQGIPLTKLYERHQEIAAEIKAEYTQCQQAHSSRITWDWHQYEGVSLDDFAAYSRHAMVSDLVVCAKPPNLELATAMPRTLLSDSQVPVLVIPEDFPPDYGFQNILLAWNESPESARAIRDSLPLLKRSELVVLVNFSTTKDNATLTGSDVAQYLGEHDIKVEIDLEPLDGDVGKKIKAHAARNYMDLVVMGGFGHSNVYNLLFGAATPQVLNDLNCPVLLSN